MEKEGNWSDRPDVSAELATKHRAAVARVVYLAQDRLDLGVAVVELAKTMAIPSPRIDWIWEWRQWSSPKPWQFPRPGSTGFGSGGSGARQNHGNSLAKDRLDLGVAAVELAKTMAIPRDGDDERLERVARYLHGHPVHMQWYPVQEDMSTVVLSADADWATCRETHRSNSGGTLQLGDHVIAAWSGVQPRIFTDFC